jgi:DNA-directed RNA polymerase specialized sigma24 family protein
MGEGAAPHRRQFRRVRGPSIPTSACGIFHAMAAARRGDATLLESWEREARQHLERSLASWRRIPADEIDEIVQGIRLAVLRAVDRGIAVKSEASWLSGTAFRVHSRVSGFRTGSPSSLTDDVPDTRESAGNSVEQGEELRELRGALLEVVLILPPPYMHAMFLHYFLRWTVTDVAAWLRLWNGTSNEGTRRILKEGRRMLQAAATGGDLVARWPRRFHGSGRWVLTPPPPVPALAALLGAASPSGS